MSDGSPRRRWVWSQDRSRNGWAVFVLPLVIYILLRAWLLGGWYERIDTEELEFGLFPAHALSGLLVPVPAYQTMVREGGSLQIAVTHTPVFALLGPSYLALKTAGAVLHGLVLLVWIAVARLGFGRKRALVFGLLFAVGPPFLARMDVMGWANHGEGNLLAGVALLSLLIGVRVSPARAWVVRLAGLGAGLACGLGVTFAFTGVPMAAVLLALIAANARGTLRHALLPAAVGLVVGLAPWVVCVEAVHGVGRLRAMVGLGGMGSALGQDVSSVMFDHRDVIQRTVQLLGLDLFRMWGFVAEDGSYRSPLNHGFGLVVAIWLATWLGARAAAVARLARDRLRIAGGRDGAGQLVAVVLPLQAIAFVGAILLSGLGGAFISAQDFDGYRYLLPIFPPVLMCASVGLVDLLDHPVRAPRWLGRATAAAAVLLLVWGQLSLSPGRTSFTAHLRGYHLRNIEQAVMDLPRQQRLDGWQTHPADRWELAMIEGRVAVRGERGAYPDRPGVGECPFTSSTACEYFWEGVGLELAWGAVYGDSGLEAAAGPLARLRSRGERRARLSLCLGLGRGYGFGLDAAEVQILLDDEELEHFVLGIGSEAVRGSVVPAWFGSDLDAALGWRAHDLWREGLGMGLARCLLEPAAAPVDPLAPRSWAELLESPSDTASFERGYRAERQRLVLLVADGP